jgi:CheY-like chemotaxis protein
MARVLVIEDDNATRQLIAFTLATAGHEVAQAGTGHEGARQFQQQKPDLVITDIIMPDDSLDTVLELRQEHPELPIILISGLAMDSPRTAAVAQALRARQILPKPFKLAELIAATATVLKG